VHLGVFCTLDHYPEAGGTVGAVYGRALEEAVLAEELGMESFWVTEHHFSPYGVCPDPAVLLATMAARTRRLRLGTATAILPLDHPLRTAERYALLDQLSGGRLEFGIGSGYLGHEFGGFGIDLEDKRRRFDEALAVVRAAWCGGPVRFHGECFSVDCPPLNVQPAQAGGPPLHVGLTRPAGAPFVGRQGLGLATVPYISLESLAELRGMVAAYRGALPQGARGEVTVAVHCFCAERAGDSELEVAEAALDRYLRTRVVPGARYSGRPIARDFVFFGDGEEVARRLRGLRAMGVDRVLLLTSFGGLPAEHAAASLRRVARLRGAA
jgi:alkanesulfonate monooxygenase SsuD/methylene tetrahydromethanopterin reductase-like flavin-dependent oxidoreductase (luciferase family)